MLTRRALVSCLLVLLFVAFAPVLRRASAQSSAATRVGSSSNSTPVASPTPSASPSRDDQEPPINVFTEEVRVPVFAYDTQGRFDPSLVPDDVLVLEDGVAQQVRSVRRIPANVLLLLDTGGQINPAKTANSTRNIALAVIAGLHAGDEVAAVQFSDSVEVMQEWTNDLDAVRHALRTKLHSGRRARLSDALAQAAAMLRDKPAGNRHVVLVTDGAESPGGRVSFASAISAMNAAQATVHVISYSTLGAQAIREQTRRTRPRIRSNVPEEVIMTLPGEMQRVLRTPGGVTVDLDREMRRRREEYAATMRAGTERLATLAEETSGQLSAPASVEEMVAQGTEVARQIAMQYVVTYTPRRPLANAAAGEYRRLEVHPRRVGLQLRARRGYIVSGAR